MRAIDRQMRDMLQTPGVRSVHLVDWRSGHTLARTGDDDRAEDAIAILRAVHTGPLCATQEMEDVVVSDADHHVLLAVLAGSDDLCLRARVARHEGNLGFALRRLRLLARTAQVPVPHRDRPPARGRGVPRPRIATPVDRSVLERVLTALRTLSTDHPGTARAVIT
ncbi:hypothetical protein RM479_11535 [Nocardiopsis sp. DSM 44743]|uniref:Uncharacterized protein n=2 Tax=Nocardiopsis lambiniae TaxID=3075539 RepID=A0ABU2M8Q3_9ACTN|nr:hypothetical protein [Nocardiopsis sp. DSM 44743]MDT0329042.1 hypothetical protein [Nocardiopsis sp. DSM 44743]